MSWLAIDPNAWMITLPLTLGMVMVYLQPQDHPLRRWWQDMQQREAQALAHFAGDLPLDEQTRAGIRRSVFLAVLGGAGAATVLSLAHYLLLI